MKMRLVTIAALLLFAFTAGAMAQQIVMNEIYSRGTATDPDWIELYNATALDVDISGYKIYDSGGKAGTKPKKALPAATVIPAKGFFVVVTDGSNTEDFGLSSGGEAVWLENAAGAVIDTIAFPAMDVTQSYSRYADGGQWKLVKPITRGTPNVVLLMNEIYSRGTATDPDWIELYNSSNAAFDITKCKIYDSGGKAGTKPKKVLAAGTVIPAKSFFVVVTDGSNTDDFGLSSGGEAVWLEDSTGAVIDTVAFTSMDVTQSFGRIPDAGVWQLLTSITRGATNGTGTSVAENIAVVRDFRLEQNYPNPFNPSTKITFSLPRSGVARLRVYNALGQQVRELLHDFRAAGTHQVAFEARGLASGHYYLKLEYGSNVAFRKMLLLQ